MFNEERKVENIKFILDYVKAFRDNDSVIDRKVKKKLELAYKELATSDSTALLIEALEYYANEDNYDENRAPGNYVGSPVGDMWQSDLGKIAKEALKAVREI